MASYPRQHRRFPPKLESLSPLLSVVISSLGKEDLWQHQAQLCTQYVDSRECKAKLLLSCIIQWLVKFNPSPCKGCSRVVPIEWCWCGSLNLDLNTSFCLSSGCAIQVAGVDHLGRGSKCYKRNKLTVFFFIGFETCSFHQHTHSPCTFALLVHAERSVAFSSTVLTSSLQYACYQMSID